MRKLFFATYGVATYLLFLATFTYAIGFIAGIPGLKTLDSGTPAPLAETLLVDLLLLGLFAIQHSVMARPGFKRAWTRVVPKEIERSTFTLAATAVLALLIWQWRPWPATVWDLRGGVVETALHMLFWAGWAVLLASTFLLNHFELFGLRQSFARLMGLQEAPVKFRTPGLYRYVRHPLYLGFVMAFWAAPVMSAGHMLFAAMSTGYILVGIWFEERDLVREFGAQYVAYRRRVGMLFPRLGRPGDAQDAPREGAL